MRSGSAGEDDRLPGGDLTAAVDDAHMTDVKPRRSLDSNIFQRLRGQRRMMLENQPMHGLSTAGDRTRDTYEADDCSIATCLLEQLRQLLLGLK